jgi:hypothetical protein
MAKRISFDFAQDGECGAPGSLTTQFSIDIGKMLQSMEASPCIKCAEKGTFLLHIHEIVLI